MHPVMYDVYLNLGSKKSPLWIRKDMPPSVEIYLNKLRELNRSLGIRGKVLHDKKRGMWVISSRKPFPHLPENLKRNMYEVYLPPWRESPESHGYYFNPWKRHGGFSVYRIPLRDLVAS